MQFILCHLDNNAAVINTLPTDVRGMLDTYEGHIFRIQTRSDFEGAQKELEGIVARLSRLRRTEPDFLRFLGGFLVILLNMKFDERFIHNICWYDIDDDGKLWSGRKKPLKESKEIS
jgi:hypothetical protein